MTEHLTSRGGGDDPAGIGRFIPVALPTASSSPFGIAAGPDGALWFTQALGNRIGRITTAGDITQFALPTTSSGPQDIVAGPDGALWFTQSNSAGNRIGRITTAAPAPSAVPTLSEWAMILFGLILAGGAALYIQRRQLIA